MLKAKDFAYILWGILNEAEGSEQKLREILASKPKAVIVAFDMEFRRAADNLRTIEVSNQSEDDLKDLYAQVVSKGNEFYDHIVDHPDRILEDTKPQDPCFYGISSVIFWELFGEDIYVQKLP